MRSMKKVSTDAFIHPHLYGEGGLEGDCHIHSRQVGPWAARRVFNHAGCLFSSVGCQPAERKGLQRDSERLSNGSWSIAFADNRGAKTYYKTRCNMKIRYYVSKLVVKLA